MSDNHLKLELLEQALKKGSGPVAFSQQAEDHLQSCRECRDRLEMATADQSWWEKASDYLREDEVDNDFESITSAIITDRTDQASSSSDPIEELTHSSILDAPSHPEMLGRIGHYDIEQVIGRGGMGVVYKGYDTQLNRAVAIKVLSPHLASNVTARKRFEREARAAAAVVHHNVIPIHGVNSQGKLPYIVMHLVGGSSLQEYIEQNGPMETKDIIRVASQIAAGLNEAYKQGLVHRDIKPANILIEDDVSRVTITDFGLARAADDAAMTQTGWLAGTPHYMSPEQSKGKNISHSSDLFSLGSLMYFMATGRVPFRGDGPMAVLNKICNEPITPVRQINSDVPRRLGDIIEKLLEKRPADRFKTALQLQQTLSEYLAYLQDPQSKKAPRKIQTRRSQRRQAISLAVSAGFLLLATFGFWWSQHAGSFLTPPDRESITENDLAELKYSYGFYTQQDSVLRSLMPNAEFDAEISSLEHDLINFKWENEIIIIDHLVPSFDASLPKSDSSALDQLQNHGQSQNHRHSENQNPFEKQGTTIIETESATRRDQ